jgi:glycosyltransferase involved in cell wall biosynthesis
MIRDHETGIVVARNSESVYTAMLELIDDAIRKKLGRNAAREVGQLTNPIEVAKKYVAIYQRALSLA